MFASLFRRFAPSSKGNDDLAGFQLDMGTITPQWERLRHLNISRNVRIGTTTQKTEIWELTFDTVRFQILMNPSIHHFDPNPHSQHRVMAVYGGQIDEEELGRLDARMWFRQIDQILEMMPRLAAFD